MQSDLDAVAAVLSHLQQGSVAAWQQAVSQAAGASNRQQPCLVPISPRLWWVLQASCQEEQPGRERHEGHVQWLMMLSAFGLLAPTNQQVFTWPLFHKCCRHLCPGGPEVTTVTTV